MITIDDFLKGHCTKSSTDEHGCKRSDGFTMVIGGDIEVPTGYEEQPQWKDGQFRTVWINNADLSTITYCEGDISVMQHKTQASYDSEIVKAAEFYQTH